MEDLETLGLTSQEYPPPQTDFLMEDFVWWTGVWRLPLYRPRIPSRLRQCHSVICLLLMA